MTAEVVDETPDGWFAANGSEPYEEAEPFEEEPPTLVGFCNVCGHAVHRKGYDLACVEGCRCLMLGCVLRPEDR